MERKNNKNREILKAHNYTTKQAIEDVREKHLTTFSGSLSTICREEHPLAGYPVCSVVPYMLDDQFRPVIYTASVAEHTHNTLANPKASIFIRDTADDNNIQTHWRICIIGNLIPIPQKELGDICEKYYRYYPDARNYNNMHDFLFFRMEVQKYRVIMGFGNIRWVAGYAPFESCPITANEKSYMIQHMNEDHVDAMRKYLDQRNIPNDDSEIAMVDINQYGFTLRHQERLNFIAFERVAEDALSAQKALIAMAKQTT